MAEEGESDVNMPEDVWMYDNKQASEYVSYNTYPLYKLKFATRYFLSNLYFSPNDNPSKTMKNVFCLI